ncbi:hypothetical protein ScPMuIL_014516 [Solemya velum]
MDAYLTGGDGSVWVFGYGSLLWKADFEYQSARIGYIRGFVRRFWQGNTTHRGVPGAPGRVATLLEEEEGLVWGVAFEITTKVFETMGYLETREQVLGGYSVITTDFTPRDNPGAAIPVIVYMATPTNDQYLGEADIQSIAEQVVASKGPAGSNVEYVTRMADFIRQQIPEDDDDHLFSLDRRVREIITRDARN